MIVLSFALFRGVVIAMNRLQKNAQGATLSRSAHLATWRMLVAFSRIYLAAPKNAKSLHGNPTK